MFYARLRESSRPHVRDIFERTDMTHLRRILNTFVVEVLAPEVNDSVLDRVRLRHRGLGLTVADFFIFERCWMEMLNTILSVRGVDVEEEDLDAWQQALRMFLPLFEQTMDGFKARSPSPSFTRQSTLECKSGSISDEDSLSVKDE